MPLLSEPNQLSPPPPHPHHGCHQRPSLGNRYCPFCKSQQLQYITNTPDFRHDSSTLSNSSSARAVPGQGEKSSEFDSTDRNREGNVTLGFEVKTDKESFDPAAISEQAPSRRERSSAFVEESHGERGGWEDLEQAHSYDKVPTHPQPQNDVVSHSETTSDQVEAADTEQQYSISSWSFSELSGHPPPQNYLRSSHDVLYHSRDQVGVEYPRRDSGDTEDSSISYSRDMSEYRHDGKSATQSKFGGQHRPKQKYNTVPTGVGRGSATASDLSRSGGKSCRLTSSEPTPKLQPHSYWSQERGSTNTPSGELRRCPSHDQPRFQQRNPFDYQGHPHSRSCTDTTTSRMRIPRASLGSVQEQPAPKSLNPFDESYCSTNPFDMDESTTSNPFGAEDDEDEAVRVERVKERQESKPSERGRGFSQNEERYFPEFQSQRKDSKGESKDDADVDTPGVSLHNVPPPSSSVPVSSFMSGLVTHPSFGSTSRDSRAVSKKSKTLPCDKSPRVAQESPEFIKRTCTTLPRGKPPIPGMLMRGKSMESLENCSPRNEHHPIKSNRIMSPHSRRRWDDPYGEVSPGGGRGSSQGSKNGGKGHRNGSMSPSGPNGGSGSGKSTPEVTRRGHSSSDTQSTGRGQRSCNFCLPQALELYNIDILLVHLLL